MNINLRVVVVGAALCVLALATAHAASTRSAFFVLVRDVTGDAQGGAADIATAEVDQPDRKSGKVVFRVTLADRQALGPDDRIEVFLDTDMNDKTGNDGDEYVLDVHGSDRRSHLAQWKDGAWSLVSATTADTPDGLTVSVPLAAIGSPKQFSAYFQMELESVDDAWDGAGPAPFFVTAATAKLTLSAPTLSPSPPRAGRVLTARLPVSRDDGTAVVGASVRCAATVAGRNVAQAGSGRIASGSGNALAVCAWKVPKSAAGKRLQASVTVVAGGLTVARPFTALVGR